jgi:hypothetical protein
MACLSVVAARVEFAAIRALVDATEKAAGTDPDLVTAIRAAQHRVTSPTRTTTAVVAARVIINRAVKMCPPKVRPFLQKAEVLARDVLSLRLQLLMEAEGWLNRLCFLKLLVEAHAEFEQMVDKAEYKTELSRCGHSYRLMAFQHFPDRFVKSNSQLEFLYRAELRRGRHLKQSRQWWLSLHPQWVGHLEPDFMAPFRLDFVGPFPPDGLSLPPGVPGTGGFSADTPGSVLSPGMPACLQFPAWSSQGAGLFSWPT